LYKLIFYKVINLILLNFAILFTFHGCFTLQASNAYMSLLFYSKIHAFGSMVTSSNHGRWCNHENQSYFYSTMFHLNTFLSVPRVLTNLNPLLSKVDWWRYCIHLSSLSTSYFKTVETMGLKIVASRSLSTALPPYQISSKSTSQSKVIRGTQTERQTGDLTSLLSFLECRLKEGSHKVFTIVWSLVTLLSTFGNWEMGAAVMFVKFNNIPQFMAEWPAFESPGKVVSWAVCSSYLKV
jgi:hypothetical protein